MNGGYKIIDLDGYSIPLGGDSVTIPGIFEQISESKKATLLENLTITSDGTTIPLRPFFVDFVLADGNLNASVFGGQAVMLITDKDAVTVSAPNN